MLDDQMAFVGKRISDLRKSYGYTQEKLAEMAEISIQFLVQIEHGQKTMKVGTLRKLSAALSVSSDYIINGSEAYSENPEINAILSTLSDCNKERAAKMLKIFAEATADKTLKPL